MPLFDYPEYVWKVNKPHIIRVIIVVCILILAYVIINRNKIINYNEIKKIMCQEKRLDRDLLGSYFREQVIPKKQKAYEVCRKWTGTNCDDKREIMRMSVKYHKFLKQIPKTKSYYYFCGLEFKWAQSPTEKDIEILDDYFTTELHFWIKYHFAYDFWKSKGIEFNIVVPDWIFAEEDYFQYYDELWNTKRRGHMTHLKDFLTLHYSIANARGEGYLGFMPYYNHVSLLYQKFYYMLPEENQLDEISQDPDIYDHISKKKELPSGSQKEP